MRNLDNTSVAGGGAGKKSKSPGRAQAGSVVSATGTPAVATTTGLQHASGVATHNARNIFDRPVTRSKHEVSLSILTFLLSEMVKYALAEVHQAHQLEDLLHEFGLRVGYRALELFSARERNSRRDNRLLQILTFISQTCWKQLFGHSAELLKGKERDNEYMISDKNLTIVKYINVPKDLGHISCAAYVAGITEGILCAAEFPAEVTAHTVEETATVTSTTLLIRFLPEVLAREKKLTS